MMRTATINRSPVLRMMGMLQLLTLALVVQQGHAVFEAGKAVDQVVALHKGNFKLAMEDPANSFWLLKFYAPW